jgi:hypothetical protein
MHTLIVPARKRRLLQDVGWHVAPIKKGSTRLQARADSNAPGIRRKQLLHRLVAKAAPHRRVRAIDGNLLNATPDNLQTCTRSDIAILNRRGELLLTGLGSASPLSACSERFVWAQT